MIEPITAEQMSRDYQAAARTFSKINPPLQEFIAAFALSRGYSFDEITGHSRVRPLAYCRQDAYAAVRNAYPAAGVKRIAGYFNRDHATVLYGIRQSQRRAAERHASFVGHG